MRVEAVHQYCVECVLGDSATETAFLLRELLSQLGVESEIFCERAAPELAGDVRILEPSALNANQLFLVHHGADGTRPSWNAPTGASGILVYQDADRSGMAPTVDDSVRRRDEGVFDGLARLAPAYRGAIALTDDHHAILRAARFAHTATLPIPDAVNWSGRAARSRETDAWLRDSTNLLYMDAICPQHAVLELIGIFDEFRHVASFPVRLILAGRTVDREYRERAKVLVQTLNLESKVTFLGDSAPAVRNSLYRCADLLIAATIDEHVDTSIIEATQFGVPVVTRAVRRISEASDAAPLTLPDEVNAAAALLLRMLSEPALRRQALAWQARMQARLLGNLRTQLANALQQFGIDLPAQAYSSAGATTVPVWRIAGPSDGRHPIGRFNLELGKALAVRGADVDSHAEWPDIVVGSSVAPDINDLHGLCRVIHVHDCRDIGSPGEYAADLNRRADLVAVPSALVRKMLTDHGVHVPIVVSGCAVDHLLKVEIRTPDVPLRAFRFLHVSSCLPETGVDAVLWSFGRAFRKHDDVSLVITVCDGCSEDIADQIRRCQRHDPDFPHVVLIDRECDDGEIAGLYASCHALVAPNRSAGYDPSIAQAMLFRLPVIATGWKGQPDICDSATAWLCDFRMSRSLQEATGSLPSVWAEPDIDHLTALMRDVYHAAPDERARRADTARDLVMRDFTWNQVARRLESAVRAVMDRAQPRATPKIGWLSTWHKRCGVAAYSSYLTVGFPADRMTILADRAAERTAPDEENVVRCWSEGSGDTLDQVYETIVERGIQTVVIQYNFGFFTVGSLGGLILRLKAIGIGVHCFFHSTGDLFWAGKSYSLRDIAESLKHADRLYVHGVPDLNRLKNIGLIDNVAFFPQGVLPVSDALLPTRRDVRNLEGKRVIAAYGFLLPHKGIRQLIMAFRELAGMDERLHLLLLNALYPVKESEDEKNACIALISEIGLQDRVTFVTDFLPEAECVAILRQAELIVYPYQRTQESSSAAVRMGLAARRPIAVTPLAIFDDVMDAVHSLPGVEVHRIADGIRDLLESPEVIARQAARTEQWVASRQWPQLSMRLLNMIDALAAPFDFGDNPVATRAA